MQKMIFSEATLRTMPAEEIENYAGIHPDDPGLQKAELRIVAETGPRNQELEDEVAGLEEYCDSLKMALDEEIKDLEAKIASIKALASEAKETNPSPLIDDIISLTL